MAEFELQIAREALDMCRSDDAIFRILDLTAHEFKAVGAQLILTDERFAARKGIFSSERFREEFSFVEQMHSSGEDADDAELIQYAFREPAGKFFTELEICKRNMRGLYPSVLRETMERHCGVSHRAGMYIGEVYGSKVLITAQFPDGSAADLAYAAQRFAKLQPVLCRALQLRAEFKWMDTPIEDRMIWVRDRYHLTGSEYKILCFMLVGSTGQEIASSCGIKYETYRSHAKNILTKTGCRSKIELAGRLIAGAASQVK